MWNLEKINDSLKGSLNQSVKGGGAFNKCFIEGVVGEVFRDFFSLKAVAMIIPG